ncbi:MAG: FAD:protein FMN transferase [Actinobacteria bacterium]|nr:FAD:protein FMN transferase [Actinomycetota bacterium]
MSRKFILIIIILAVFLSIILFRTKETNESKNVYVKESFLMDTLVTIKIYDAEKKPGQKAVKTALEEIKKIDRISNNFDPDSEISKINKKPEKYNIKVSKDLFRMLSLSKKYSSITNNSFDVTVASLVSLWGFEDKKQVPAQSELKEALNHTGSEYLTLNQKNQTISFLKKNMS